MTEVLVRAEGLDVNEVPDGYVIYQTEADRVHYLNKTAAIVFELCDGAREHGRHRRAGEQDVRGGGDRAWRDRGVRPIAAQGGAGPIAFEVIARTWARHITLSTSDPAVYQALRYLECDPDIDRAPSEHIAYTVEPFRSYYRIAQDGVVMREQITPRGVSETLHAELTIISLGDFPNAPLIHAASLRRDGRRILLVGPKGGGKTTLTLHLIRAGYAIEGDENVFVTADGVVARPRALRVKQSAACVHSASRRSVGRRRILPERSRHAHLQPRPPAGGSGVMADRARAGRRGDIDPSQSRRLFLVTAGFTAAIGA